MSTVASVSTPTTTPVSRSASGQLRLLIPTRDYAVTRNPFAIPAILPLVTLTFAALALAMAVISDAYLSTIVVAAFATVTVSLLAIPAVALKGSINLTHDGISFVRGKQHLTAGWDQVTGIVYRFQTGLCLMIRNPLQSTPRMRLPGGFHAQGGEARIPLRLFGDRQFSILYDIRDRLPEAAWRPALEAASKRSKWRILSVYGLTVACAGAAIFAVMYTVTH